MSDDREREHRFLGDARRVLAEDADNLDAPTLDRLRAARQRAVAAVSAGPRRKPAQAAAVVTAGLAATLALWLAIAPRPVAPVPEADNVEDMDLLTGAEGLQFYKDLDFYCWLDREQDAG